MSVGSTDWTLNVVSGGKPAVLPYSRASASLFSMDGRYSIVLLTHQIRVYFISTRQCIRVIECDASDVIDFKLDPSNSNHVLLFKTYGEILSVNWKDKVSQPIVGRFELEIDTPLLALIDVTSDSYYTISGKKDKRGLPQTRYIHKIDRISGELTPLKEVSNITKLSISLDGSKIAFITKDNEILLVELTIIDSVKKPNHENGVVSTNLSTEIIKLPFKSPITSMAVSNDSIIAVGTASGTIQLLYGGLINDKPQRLFKWHNDQVKALQFSADNKYLLSGGLEKVLVFWQLETEKTQFLPRLSGIIDKISIDQNRDDYYQLLLKVSSDSSEEIAEINHDTTNVAVEELNENDTHEVLIISAVDLVSRLSVNSIRPKFSHPLKSTLQKTKKKFLKNSDFDKSKLRYDYSSIFEVHPKSKNLYFPNDSVIQAYDLVKNEQNFIQNATSVISTGKVKSETKLIDAEVSVISFTKDGEWMCTFDSMLTSDFDNLLSKGDKQYALKFWKYIEGPSLNSKNGGSGHWELSTKIIDPHGSNPIIACIPSPLSYFNGQAFVTVDSKGSLRLWRPKTTKEHSNNQTNSHYVNARSTQTAWTLRRSKLGGSLNSSSIDICWSDDSSIIILGHECSISVVNVQTFEAIPFNIPSISGSPIRSLSILNNNLIVLSKSRLCSFNLLNGEMNDLYAKVNTTHNGKNLITYDHSNNLICLAVNYYNVDEQSKDFGIKSKILIFRPDLITPIHVSIHNQGISSVRYFNSSFIFVDLDSRIGVVKTSNAPTPTTPVDGEFDLTNDMNNMLISAQATADVINNRNVNVKQGGLDTEMQVSNDEDLELNRAIDLNSLQPIFDNIDGIPLDNLFDRIIKVIK